MLILAYSMNWVSKNHSLLLACLHVDTEKNIYIVIQKGSKLAPRPVLAGLLFGLFTIWYMEKNNEF